MNRPQEEPWQARARGRIRDRRARKRARGQVVTLDAVPLSRLVVVEVEAVQDSGAVPATEWMAVSFPAEPANDFAFYRRHACPWATAGQSAESDWDSSWPEELPIASLLPEAVGTRCRASRFCEARATRWLHHTVSLYVRMRICQIACR